MPPVRGRRGRRVRGRRHHLLNRGRRQRRARRRRARGARGAARAAAGRDVQARGAARGRMPRRRAPACCQSAPPPPPPTHTHAHAHAARCATTRAWPGPTPRRRTRRSARAPSWGAARAGVEGARARVCVCGFFVSVCLGERMGRGYRARVKGSRGEGACACCSFFVCFDGHVCVFESVLVEKARVHVCLCCFHTHVCEFKFLRVGE